MTADYQSPPLRIQARVANHARAGMLHAATAVFHAAGTFTALQVEQLKRDPELMVDETTPAGALHIEPEKLEEQMRTHLANDPASFRAMLQRLLPDAFRGPVGAVIMPRGGADGGAPVETFVSQDGAGGRAGSASVSTEPLPLDAGVRAMAPNGDMPAGVLMQNPATLAAAAAAGAQGLSSGVEQSAARQVHTLEVAGASPAPAPNAGDPPPPPPVGDADPGPAKGGKGAKGAAS